MKNKIILFDIDYTLFNTTLYKELVAKALEPFLSSEEKEDMYQLVEKVYYEVRALGNFHPQYFAQAFISITNKTHLAPKTIEDILWNKELMEKSLYPEVAGVLKALHKNNTVGIFSTGDMEFQKAKIMPFKKYFTSEHIHIFDMKDVYLPQTMKKYKNKDVVIIDDFLSILESAKEYKPDVISVWMKRGKFAENEKSSPENEINYTIENLKELIPLFDK